jgi:hypothetical protein
MNVENIMHLQKLVDLKILENFSKTLSKLNFENHLLFKDDLSKRT